MNRQTDSPFLPNANSPEVFASSANENPLTDGNPKDGPAGGEQKSGHSADDQLV